MPRCSRSRPSATWQGSDPALLSRGPNHCHNQVMSRHLMPAATSASVLARIAASGIVPVVRIERAEDAPELARTLAGAGLPCIEITFRSAAAVDAIRAIRAQVPEVLV